MTGVTLPDIYIFPIDVNNVFALFNIDDAYLLVFQMLERDLYLACKLRDEPARRQTMYFLLKSITVMLVAESIVFFKPDYLTGVRDAYYQSATFCIEKGSHRFEA